MPKEVKYTIILSSRSSTKSMLLGGFDLSEKDKAPRFASVDEAVRHMEESEEIIAQSGCELIRIAPILEKGGFGRTSLLYEYAGGKFIKHDFISKNVRYNQG